jgi:hypothetical protein
MKDEENL